jgi:broad specificity phosphatase PhoE
MPTHSTLSDGIDATLVLVRHGESTAIVEGRFQGQTDVPLSPMGLRQAELVAGRLAKPHQTPALPVPACPPLEIVHSPLARATQTAAAIGAAVTATTGSVPLRPDDGLTEIHQGEWEGRPATEIAERWGDILAAWRRTPLEAWSPGGESIREVETRVRPSLSRLLDRLADGRASGRMDRPQVLNTADPAADQPWTILVGHDGVFKVALLTLLDLPLERFWSIPFALCGITIVELMGGRARLRAHNITDHLAPLEERAQAVSEERERTGAL